MRLAPAVTVACALLATAGCGWLFARGHATGYAAIVRGRVTSVEGTAIAEGCEAGTSMDGLSQPVRSVGARVLRVPDRPGARLRLTLRFQDVESELPDDADPNDDRVFCDARYLTRQRSRPLPLGCHAALHVVGSDPPAEITRTAAMVEDGGEAGFILDLTVRHAGVLRVQTRAPCPLHEEFALLTVGELPAEPGGAGGTSAVLAR